MQIKTVVTVNGVNTVNFGDTPGRFYWLKNIGWTPVHVSTSPSCTADADDVALLGVGETIMIQNYGSCIYILGAGKVEIYETDSPACPFSAGAGKSSGGDIPDIGELIPPGASAANPLVDKAYVDVELSEKIDKDDIITNEMIDRMTP